MPKVGASPARPVGRVTHDIFSYYERFLLGRRASAALGAAESRGYDRISKKSIKFKKSCIIIIIDSVNEKSKIYKAYLT